MASSWVCITIAALGLAAPCLAQADAAAMGVAEPTPATAPRAATRPVTNATAEELLLASTVDVAQANTQLLWPSRFIVAQASLFREHVAASEQALEQLAWLASELYAGAVHARRAQGGCGGAAPHCTQRAWSTSVNLQKLAACIRAGEPQEQAMACQGGSRVLTGKLPLHEGSGKLLSSLNSLRAVALLGLQRWEEMENYGQPPSKTGGKRSASEALGRVQFHVVPRGVMAYEMEHVSADPFLPTGVLVVRVSAPTQEDQGMAMGFVDPRGDAPNVHPLPKHLADTEYYPLPLSEGLLAVFPGDVPRWTSANTGSKDLVYISFQPAPQPAGSGGPSHDCGTGRERSDATQQCTEGTELPAFARGKLFMGAAGATKPMSRPQPELRAAYTLISGDVMLASFAGDALLWGTPVAVLRTSGVMVPTINSLIRLEAMGLEMQARLDDAKLGPDRTGQTGRGAAGSSHSGASFQSDAHKTNFLYDDPGELSQAQFQGSRILRVVVEKLVHHYLNASVACSPAWRCQQQADVRAMWKVQAEMSPANPRVYQSWINVARANQQTPYTRAHNHMGQYPRSILTGTYYASSGYDDPAETTEIRLLRPTMLNNPARRLSDVVAIPTTPGTYVLFPAYVKHSGDLHLGTTERISVAFNIVTDDLVLFTRR